MKDFDIHDQRHLEAAEGWLELGDLQSANDELEEITPLMRGHPFVLEIKYQIYAKAKKWEMAVEMAREISSLLPDNSFGWIQMAFSLHELKRTKDAWDTLLPVVDKFPNEPTIRYNLACYACQLGKLKESMEWLKGAIHLCGKKPIRSMALVDPDLKPLWKQIGKI